MAIKTATYSGMNLKGEIRESISLDDDDISDVEDEVFIRDGKNGYKLAEELNVKRPLMAPRRRPCKYDGGRRMNKKGNYKAWCKPCCYALASFSILLGLIVLVVVLVSIYPLPLDQLREWITSKSKPSKPSGDRLPCTSLNVTEVWAVNFPGLTTESPTRVLDIDGDGIKDIIFGFGTGGNDNLVAPKIFCPIFLGVPPPCDGGLIALNGKNGNVMWKQWINDTIFGLHCSADVNADGVNDCLYVGIDGTIAIVNSKQGKHIWKLNPGKISVFLADFISDQNGDNVSDVIASCSSLEENASGRIVLLSGKTGETIKEIRTPNGTKTFYMPQVLHQNTSSVLLFGTGTPGTPGNLSTVPVKDMEQLENNSRTLYEDKFNGMLTQSILVDITGDKIQDIVTSTYNSSIVAIDGKTYKQIWKFNVSGAVTDMSPTPAFFNGDNVTDFMVIYQKYDDILKYNYTQTLIIDGFTGQPIYKPVSGGIITQMNALTLSMDGKGHDIFIFWTSECSETDRQIAADKTKASDHQKLFDQCRKQFNASTILKLNALNAYHQPPGITIYNSALHTDFEFNNTKSPMKMLREYFNNYSTESPAYNPSSALNGEIQLNSPKGLDGGSMGVSTRQFGKSNFRHKDRPGGIIKDYGALDKDSNGNGINIAAVQMDALEDPKISNSPGANYIWMPNQVDEDQEFSNYNMDDDNIPYNQKQLLMEEVAPNLSINDRNFRSNKKVKTAPENYEGDSSKKADSTKKNLSDKIYGYHNVRMSKERLLHDEETLPTDILQENYFKNEENRLKKMKLEQRDVNSHMVGEMDLLDVNNIIKAQKNYALQNRSTTLWDIESENELGEREDKGYLRRKRGVKPEIIWESSSVVTSVGAILTPFNTTTEQSNIIDLFYIKYWQPLEVSLGSLKATDIEECILEKQLLASGRELSEQEQENYKTECQRDQEILKRNFPFFDNLSQLKMGQLTAYRIRIQCKCDSSFNKQIEQQCANFLPEDLQGWPQYLGAKGDGVFYS
ncbi:uncharacterized protein [Euwallacea similis]